VTRTAVVFDVLGEDVRRLVRSAATSGEVVLVSDVRTPRVEQLERELNGILLVANHRMVDSGKGPRLSDIDLAARLTARHLETPLDSIVYATDALTDLSWHEPVLSHVPKGRALTGLLRRVPSPNDDSAGFPDSVVRAIALAGDATLSDFVVGVGSSPILHPHLSPHLLASPGRTAKEGEGSFHTLDVMDLDMDATIEVVSNWALGREGILLVVGTDLSFGGALQSLLPTELAERVIYGLESDPWVEELIGVADSIEVSQAPDRGAEVEYLSCPSWDEVPAVRHGPQVLLVTGDNPGKLMSVLERLRASGSNEAVVAVRKEAYASLFVGTRAPLADLAFVAASSSPMGDLDPRSLRDDAVLIGVRARSAAIGAALQADSLRSLVFRLAEASLVSSAVIGLVPGESSDEPLTLRISRSPHDTGSRILPSLLAIRDASTAPPDSGAESIDSRAMVDRWKWGTRPRHMLRRSRRFLSRLMRGQG